MKMHSTRTSRQRQSVSRPYKQESSGLLLPIHATLKGRARWQVLDERGVPEIPRNPSGFAIGPIEGVEQPNLITDHGLNRIAELNVFEEAIDFTPSVDNWRRRLAVGTGSTAPAVTDTTLDAEVERASTSGTFDAGGFTGELDTVNNVWRATGPFTRLVTMSADRNLTEYGLAQLTTADIHIRELFRDGVGTPVTISLLSGKSLKLDHTLTIEMPAPAAGNAATINIEEYDATNALVATTSYDVIHGGVARGTDSGFIMGSNWTTGPGPFLSWNPGVTGGSFTRIAVAKTYATLPSGGSDSDYEPAGNTTAPIAEFALEPYVAGSFQRIARATFPTGSGNAAWYGFGRTGRWSSYFYREGGWWVLFDSPATYTKESTDTLRAGLISSWARA